MARPSISSPDGNAACRKGLRFFGKISCRVFREIENLNRPTLRPKRVIKLQNRPERAAALRRQIHSDRDDVPFTLEPFRFHLHGGANRSQSPQNQLKYSADHQHSPKRSLRRASTWTAVCDAQDQSSWAASLLCAPADMLKKHLRRPESNDLPLWGIQ